MLFVMIMGRRTLAGVDCAAGLSPPALSGLSFGVESQFQPALHLDPGGLVEKMGRAEFPALLWDSRRSLPLLGPARTSLSARLGINLWDSQTNEPNSGRPRHVK